MVLHYPFSMQHLIEQLTPNLSNASALSSMLTLFPDHLQDTIKHWIMGVVEDTDPGSLKDRDLLTYIKLSVKYPKTETESQLEDFLSYDQLDQLKQFN